MKDKPIIFSTPMVQAIIDGRKTQTRRVAKPLPLMLECGMPYIPHYYVPHYQVGQKLWVREKWCYGKVIPVDNPDGFIVEQCEKYDDFLPYEAMIRENIGIEEVKWKPSIFMPMKYARIWLEVTNVRIEELQDITFHDAIKEGCPFSSYDVEESQWHPVEWFVDLWDSINKNRGYGWDINPHVWVIEFKKIKG